MFALGAEEVGPGNDLGVLFEQCATLTFGHPTPDPELDAVVEGIGTAFQNHGAVPADDRGFALGGSADEQFVRVRLSTAGLSHPGNPGLGLRSLDQCAG